MNSPAVLQPAKPSVQTESKVVLEIENERKFLVKFLPPDLNDYEHNLFRGGYVARDLETNTVVRVRDEGGNLIQTVKKGGPVKPNEVNFTIPRTVFEKLYALTEGARIDKTRYLIPYGERTIELDIFHGELEGLIIAEVEFDDDIQRAEFVPPPWFDEEISGREDLTNSTLAGTKFSDLPISISYPARLPTLTLEKEEGLNFTISKIESLLDKAQSPVVILVAGGSASGKTSAIADAIQSHFGDKALLFSMDDASKGNSYLAELAEKGIHLNWDHPSYVDTELVAQLLREAKSGKVSQISIPSFSFITGERGESKLKDVKPLIIVEGLFALSPELQKLADYSIFVDIGVHGRMVRRLLRDIHRTTMKPDAIIGYFASTVDPMHQRYVQPQLWSADLIINNEYKERKESARAGISDLQKKIKNTITPENLIRIGAQRLMHASQSDLYLSTPKRNFKSTDEVIRIRNEGDGPVLVYKGPRNSNGPKARWKFEVPLSEESEAAIRKLYSGDSFSISKSRTSFFKDNVIISIDTDVIRTTADKIEELGNWVEFRATSEGLEDKIDGLIAQLWGPASTVCSTTESYATL